MEPLKLDGIKVEKSETKPKRFGTLSDVRLVKSISKKQLQPVIIQNIDETPELIVNKPQSVQSLTQNANVADPKRRIFLRLATMAGLGMVAAVFLPQKAEALILGSSPTTGVVGVKNDSDTRINPATEDTLLTLLNGQSVEKLTTSLTASGNVHTPASGKKIRVYSTRFSLTADLTSVGFRFTSGGTDYERYVSPKLGGLYGANNHPNFVEGGIDEPLYCSIVGTATVQINVDYLEV